jgi:hypothetical protein
MHFSRQGNGWKRAIWPLPATAGVLPEKTSGKPVFTEENTYPYRLDLVFGVTIQ